ncbi:MAG: hypothetical protein M3Y58_02420 [Chloroflexota bacterium]|nr:hypothetical protein [Chloroflexota bacterium]
MQMSDKVQATNLKEGLTDSQDARLRVLQGSLADIPCSSDDFAKMKQEAITQEARKFARPFPDAR